MQSVTFHLSQNARRCWLVLAVAAAVLLGVSGLLMPIRAWNSALIATCSIVTIALGGLVFIAFEYITGAGWSVVFRRVPEALAMSLSVTGLVLLLLIATGSSSYAWHPSDNVEAATFWFKELWLAPSWLVLRAAVYIVLWSLLGWAVVTVSRRQDQTRAITETFANRRLSACMLLVFAPTFSLAAADWFMSLEPMWFSTVWGAYHFAALAMSTLASTVLFSLYLRRAGPFSSCFRADHLHDLGKLLFGFSCLWMYLWFSQ